MMMVESMNIAKGGETFNIGANDAEGAEAEVDDNVEMVNNVVESFGYTATTMDGNGLKSWLKDFMGAILEIMKKNDAPVDDRKAFKARAAVLAKFLLSNFKELDFYLGPSFNPESMVFAMYNEGASYPNFYYIKDGLKEQKF